MVSEQLLSPVLCPRCGAINEPSTEVCSACYWYLGGARRALAARDELTTEETSQGSGVSSSTAPILEPRQPNDLSTAWPVSTGQTGEEPSFWGSLGLGCGSLVVANIATNAIVFTLAASGVFRDLSALLCVNLVLLTAIAAAIIGFASHRRQQKGQAPLDSLAIGAAIGIFILIQIIAIPLLRSRF